MAALTLAVLAGCASTDTAQATKREESYTPLGSLIPRKTGQGIDDRTQIDKEEFKRQVEQTPGVLERH